MIFERQSAKNHWEVRAEQLTDIIDHEIPHVLQIVNNAAGEHATSISVRDAFSPKTAELVERLFAENQTFLIQKLHAQLREAIKCNIEKDSVGRLTLSWDDVTLFAPKVPPTSGDDSGK